MVLAKITIKHEHSSTVMGVAAYHELVCVVYSVRISWKHAPNTQYIKIESKTIIVHMENEYRLVHRSYHGLLCIQCVFPENTH
jgi:hypothetical protein